MQDNAVTLSNAFYGICSALKDAHLENPPIRPGVDIMNVTGV